MDFIGHTLESDVSIAPKLGISRSKQHRGVQVICQCGEPIVIVEGFLLGGVEGGLVYR